MSEDLKEIIDDFKDVVEDNCTMYSREITIKEAKVLLDYITNLQEENEKLKEKLKNNGIVKTCENCEWFGVCPHSYREYDYKSKIDKAVEYCNNNIEFTPRLIDVIDILRGDE